MNNETTKEKNPAAVALGALGGAAGKGVPKRNGKKNMRKAALRRWEIWRERKARESGVKP